MLEFYVNALLGGLLLGAVYALLATGLNVIFGVMRMVNFAHGEMVVIGMYVGYGVWKFSGLSPLLVVPLAALLLFGFGYVFQRAVANRFIEAPQHIQFILYIALALIITGLFAVFVGPDPRGIQSAASFNVYRIGWLRFGEVRTQAALASLALVAALWAWFKFSLTGRAIEAAAENRVGGRAIGIRIPHLFALTAGLGFACAGAAGALVAPLFDVQPYLGAEFTLLGFIIVIVGGLASLPGALVGGLLIGLAEALAATLIAPSMKAIFSYALLVLVLLLRPQGLFGRKEV